MISLKDKKTLKKKSLCDIVDALCMKGGTTMSDLGQLILEIVLFKVYQNIWVILWFIFSLICLQVAVVIIKEKLDRISEKEEFQEETSEIEEEPES